MLMVYVMMDSIKYKLQAIHRLNVIIGILSLLLILLSSIGLSAQDTYSIKYTIEDGLPSNEVYDIETDNEGKIWYTTDRGIGHFDGYEFVNYTKADGIGDNVNFEIFKDWQGRLWFCGRNEKVTIWENGTFRTVNIPVSKHTVTRSPWIDKIVQLSQDTLLLLPYSGGNSVITYSISKNTYTVDFLPDSGKHTYKGIVINSECHFRNLMDFELDYQQCYQEFCVLQNGGRIIVSQKNSNESSELIFGEHVECVKNTPQGLYVASLNGVFNVVNMNGKYTSRRIEESAATGIIIDRDKGLWLSFLQDGLQYIPFKEIKKFKKASEFNRNRLVSVFSDKDVLIVSNDKGQILGYNKGLVRVDSDLTTLWTESPMYYNYWQGILHNFTGFDIYIHDDGYDIVPTVSNRYIRSVKLDDETFVVMGSNSIFVSNIVFNISFTYDKKIDFDSRLYSVLIFDEQSILVGSENGLYKANLKDESITPIAQNIGSPVVKIIPLGDGYAFSTIGDGVGFYIDQQIIMFGEEEGLSSDIIEDINLTNDGELYVCSESGIDILSLTNDKINIVGGLDFSDGVLSSQIRGVAECNDTTWLITDSDILYFSSDLFDRVISDIPISFDNMKVSGTEIEYDSSAVYSFGEDENDIRIEYSSVNFRDLKRPQYKYKLEDDEEVILDWTHTKDNFFQAYNMAPGSYIFSVNARNAQGVWNKDPKVVQFKILPHFTNTAWFRTLIVLSVFLAVSFYYYLRWIRMNRLQEAQRRANVAELRARKSEIAALRNQMNPHFIYNTLNSLQNFIFKQDPVTSNKVLTKFSRMVRNSLRFASLASVSLKDELSFIKDYLELEIIRFPDRFEYRIDHNELSKEECYIPTLILQPLIENCIRHGFRNIDYKGLIAINMTAHHKDYAKIRIIDNGMGSANVNKRFEESNKLSHQIVRDRVELLRSGGYEHTSFRILSLDAGYGVELILPSNNLN